MSNEDIATVLSDIANACNDETANTTCAQLRLKIALIITDWLDDRGDNLAELYNKKLIFPK